jgi:hypothetical protein
VTDSENVAVTGIGDVAVVLGAEDDSETLGGVVSTATPVPVRGALGSTLAFEVTSTDADLEPGLVGANATEKVVEAPETSDVAVPTVFNENWLESAPDSATARLFIVVAPVFLTVNVCAALVLPTLMFPNAFDVGERSATAAADAIPCELRTIASTRSGAASRSSRRLGRSLVVVGFTSSPFGSVEGHQAHFGCPASDLDAWRIVEVTAHNPSPVVRNDWLAPGVPTAIVPATCLNGGCASERGRR